MCSISFPALLIASVFKADFFCRNLKLDEVLVILNEIYQSVLHIALHRQTLAMNVILGNGCSTTELLAELGSHQLEVLAVVLHAHDLGDDFLAASVLLIDPNNSLVLLVFSKFNSFLWFFLTFLFFLHFLGAVDLIILLLSLYFHGLALYFTGSINLIMKGWAVLSKPGLAVTGVLLTEAAVFGW